VNTSRRRQHHSILGKTNLSNPLANACAARLDPLQIGSALQEVRGVLPIEVKEYLGLLQQATPVAKLLLAQLRSRALMIRGIARHGEEIGFVEDTHLVGCDQVDSLHLLSLEGRCNEYPNVSTRPMIHT
jgi:hypothetical protein